MPVPVRRDVSVHEVGPDDETVLYDEAGGTLLVLSELGVIVWMLIDGARDAAAIAAVVSAALAVDAETVEGDVSEFLEDLARRGLLDWR